jgi:hypothetical protein
MGGSLGISVPVFSALGGALGGDLDRGHKENSLFGALGEN